MISLVTTLVPKDGKKDFVEEELQVLIKDTKANEPGCLVFELMVDEDNDHFIIYNTFKDQAALNIHLKQPYVTRLKGNAHAESVEAVDVKMYERIGGFGQ